MTVSFAVAAKAVISLLILMLIGFYSAKTGIIDEPMSKKLSKLTVNVAQPFMLFNALVNVEYSRDNLFAGLSILGIAMLSHAILALFSFLAAHYVRRDRVERILTEYSITFVNAGFMGFPLLQTMFGDIGLFWGAFYVVAFNLSVWSYGMIVLSRGKDKDAPGEKIRINPLKMVLNHGTTPCLVGFRGSGLHEQHLHTCCPAGHRCQSVAAAPEKNLLRCAALHLLRPAPARSAVCHCTDLSSLRHVRRLCHFLYGYGESADRRRHRDVCRNL